MENQHSDVLNMTMISIWDNPNAKALVLSQDLDEDVFKDTVLSTEVIAMPMLERGGGKKIVWNVYVNPPMKDVRLHDEWCKTIRETVFATALYGIAKPRVHPRCVGCKSIDHPTGLCPFPKLGGSFARPHSNVPPAHLRGAARGSFRGTRGRMSGAVRINFPFHFVTKRWPS